MTPELKTATYTKLDGTPFVVEYDPQAPCIVCHEPVIAASVGGTAVCPWCDCGVCRHCGQKKVGIHPHTCRGANGVPSYEPGEEAGPQEE